jgi:hypothetical protein
MAERVKAVKDGLGELGDDFAVTRAFDHNPGEIVELPRRAHHLNSLLRGNRTSHFIEPSPKYGQLPFVDYETQQELLYGQGYDHRTGKRTNPRRRQDRREILSQSLHSVHDPDYTADSEENDEYDYSTTTPFWRRRTKVRNEVASFVHNPQHRSQHEQCLRGEFFGPRNRSYSHGFGHPQHWRYYA